MNDPDQLILNLILNNDIQKNWTNCFSIISQKQLVLEKFKEKNVRSN
ncbi:hypothetical protein M153_1520007646 [Pseudoloma neurophilia]|uniref:Uncharacterized protein n=1 Tax=Pseudoloma neurophilia TaxID=146866 RepID=A0A0R0LZM5_9MICR|nr:hypothetical protein M153_1520007646 [Pseudoloma neurophilia]